MDKRKKTVPGRASVTNREFSGMKDLELFGEYGEGQGCEENVGYAGGLEGGRGKLGMGSCCCG